ncbi:cupin domain-containing protein [Actinomadura rifamycini]|uniref:cupin domain-containing protein n=1 Tax=Actinomadura rifamycini TaxID=31962 RepID=UPI00040BAE54|nr:cupin domain-containing protein [Actinomadura rifamycini]
MSYPDPRYFGENGEVSAVFRPAGAAPDHVSRGGVAYHYLSTKASTGGEYGLYRVDMGPEAGGPATHFHRSMSEAFFILSGTVRLFDGERWVDGTSGDHLYVPVGGLHAFRNESGEPASMLMLFAPGAPREEYFENVTELAGLSEDERAEFFLRHDNFFV